MASTKSPVEFDALERQWLQKAAQLQRTALIRSRAKENAGGEIYALRTKEIQALDALLLKLEGL